jgi:hypothetical protein
VTIREATARPANGRRHGEVLLLVPADPLRPPANERFAAGAAAARDAGIPVAFIDHEALADPGGAQRAVARVPGAGGLAVYRGWMMSSASYATLDGALAARGVTLRTGAAVSPLARGPYIPDVDDAPAA